MQLIRQPVYDLSSRPFMVIWETTRACDLACKHCRAEAQPDLDPQTLSNQQAKDLVDQVEALGSPRPLFILTGGDPFKRPDIFEVTAYAAERGLPVALSPSGTPLLTRANLERVKDAGCKAISLSVDISDPQQHDTFRGVPGSFEWTLNGWKIARELGLKVQINTTVTRYNLFDLPAMFSLVRELGVMTWSLFFLVPTGRGQAVDEISADDYEAVLHFLYDASQYVSLKTTEGHHYKRVVLQRSYLKEHRLPVREYFHLNKTYDRLTELLQAELASHPSAPEGVGRMRRAPMNVNAGDGFVFISHQGEVFPSGYLPISAGNVLDHPLGDIYRESPLFLKLRDKDQLGGRCGQCEYRSVCGGSRSRAFAVSGDYLGEEPFCAYQPGSFPFSNLIPTGSD